MRINPKHLILRVLYNRRWPPSRPLEDGYTILLPSPMDMPFMLRFALEGLRHIDTQNCKQILVVPDAWGTDGGRVLQQVVQRVRRSASRDGSAPTDRLRDRPAAQRRQFPLQWRRHTLADVCQRHGALRGANTPSFTMQTPSSWIAKAWNGSIVSAAIERWTPWV